MISIIAMWSIEVFCLKERYWWFKLRKYSFFGLYFKIRSYKKILEFYETKNLPFITKIIISNNEIHFFGNIKALYLIVFTSFVFLRDYGIVINNFDINKLSSKKSSVVIKYIAQNIVLFALSSLIFLYNFHNIM